MNITDRGSGAVFQLTQQTRSSGSGARSGLPLHAPRRPKTSLGARHKKHKLINPAHT